MRRPLTLALLAALALALAGWLALRASAERAPGPVPRGDASAPELDEPAALAPADAAAAPPAPEPPRASVAAEADPTRVAVGVAPEPEPPPPLAPSLRVVVVDERGTPVPFADVAWVEQDDVDPTEAEAAFREQPDLAALVARFGGTGRADADGALVLAGVEPPLFVVCTHGDLRGDAAVEDELPAELRVEVRPIVELRARVVDGAGMPVAGVPVALRMHRWGGFHDTFFGYTDGLGIASIAHAREVLAVLVEDDRCSLALAFPLSPPVEAFFDRGAPPREPLELVAPQTGELEVLVVDGAGRLVGDPTVVHVHDEHGALPVDSARHNVPYFGATTTAAGRALFAHVGVGLQLLVRVGDLEEAGSDGEQRVSEVRVEGPRVPGARATVRVSVEHDPAALEGVLLRADGTPVARARAIARLRAEAGYVLDEERVQTDASGRFRMLVYPDRIRVGSFEIVLLETGAELAARLPLTTTPESGARDVGDLRLEPLPLLVAGRVVDQDGAPVPRARVHLGFAEYGIFRHGDPVAHTDGDGRFAVRGFAQRDAVVLAAAREEYLEGAETAFAAGRADVELVLVRGGVVEGRVLFDEVVRADDLDLRLVCAGAEEHAYVPAQIDPDGSYRFGDLRPGVAELRVSLASTDEPLVRIERIAVAAASSCDDPRLGSIDLRGLVRRVVLRVVDESGAPVSDADAAGGDFLARPAGDSIELLTSRAAIDVTVHAPGFRTKQLSGVSSDRTVVLAPGIAVRLVVVAGLPEPPWTLRAGLLGKEFGGSVAFDGSAEAMLVVPSPGSFAVLATLGREGLQEGEHLDISPGLIQVADTRDEQRFELSVAPAELEAALRRLEEDE